MAQAITVVGYEKRLTSTDVSQKLTVPGHWLEILPSIEDNNNNVQIRVLDREGMYWEFYLSKRSAGDYKKPVFQSKEWLQFVRKKGLNIGDKIAIQREDDHFRGSQYRVMVGMTKKLRRASGGGFQTLCLRRRRSLKGAGARGRIKQELSFACGTYSTTQGRGRRTGGGKEKLYKAFFLVYGTSVKGKDCCIRGNLPNSSGPNPEDREGSKKKSKIRDVSCLSSSLNLILTPTRAIRFRLSPNLNVLIGPHSMFP
ncbi:hypothetical protein FNV43_RR18705 [Rhamnella rubrinervis]|uniref:TF-B3 domain-containing protein n=1 Tax=Rhamnella rubrinervis TaxID=2594499 RepID=A0A8K0E169_9ROSA|nr:hypothetical protein FNV43_RR18705 [Rhamnella rubrinervis]